MSVRQFARRFHAATGASPHAWLVQRRLEAAQELLERTDEPVEAVLAATGFGSASLLRLHFQRRYDTTPTAQRATFAAAGGAAGGAM